MKPTVTSLHLGERHSRITSGRRDFFVVERTKKYVTLVALANLERLRIPVENYDAGKPEEREVPRAHLVERVKANTLSYNPNEKTRRLLENALRIRLPKRKGEDDHVGT